MQNHLHKNEENGSAELTKGASLSWLPIKMYSTKMNQRINANERHTQNVVPLVIFYNQTIRSYSHTDVYDLYEKIIDELIEEESVSITEISAKKNLKEAIEAVLEDVYERSEQYVILITV